MGRIRILATRKVEVLDPTVHLGRNGHPRFSFNDQWVSRAQAMIYWERTAWRLRHLSAGKKTWLKGVPMDPFVDPILHVGDKVALGRPVDHFEFVADDPPVAYARNEDTGEVVEEEEDGIHLPGDLGIVRVDGENGRVLVAAGEPAPVGNRVGAWTLYFPEDLALTAPALHCLSDATLVFHVPEFGEVSLRVRWADGTEFDLGPSRNFSVLLRLAKDRVAGNTQGLYLEDLKDRRMTDAAIELGITRIKRALLLAGIHDGADIVQAHNKRRRIGVPPERIVEEKEE